jgi:hypothetical protein
MIGYIQIGDETGIDSRVQDKATLPWISNFLYKFYASWNFVSERCKTPKQKCEIFFPILEKNKFYTVKDTQARIFICEYYQQQHTKPSSKQSWIHQQSLALISSQQCAF